MKKGVKILSWLMVIFLLSFLAYFILNHNYEFIGYITVVGILFFILVWSNKYYDFPIFALWLFAIWVVLHMLGGSIYIGGTRLYDLILLNWFNGADISKEFVILKYDQFIHAYCYVAIASLIYFMLKQHMKPRQTKALIIFTILAAVGVGLLNEVIEFGLVLFAGAAETVGGYYNTALDLVFNLIGAILGAILAKTVLDK
jgi:uncharacterized membrane protein YjdF